MGFLALLFLLSARTLTVEGYVTDEESGAPLQGARVELGRSAWALTDSLGHYALEAERAGASPLRVTRLGYKPQMFEVILPSFGTLRVDVALPADPIVMPLVRVSALRPTLREAGRSGFDNPNVRRLTGDQLRATRVLGEPDMLGAFALEHDVSFTPESPTEFHVRGGSSDQVRFLIDGVPFYNAVHGAGAFGAINPDALDAVSLSTGARSAADGRSLAGTVDAQSLQPDSTRISARGGVSTATARLTVSGPLAFGRSAFVLAARFGKPALFAGRPDRSRLTAEFSDWLVKSDTRLGAGTFTLLGALAEDRTAFSTRTESDTGPSPTGRHAFDWIAATVAATWLTPLKPGMTLRTSAWRADFDGDASWLGASRLTMRSMRRTVGVQSSLVRSLPDAEIRAGVDLLRDRIGYGAADTSDGGLAGKALSGSVESSVALFAEYWRRFATNWDVRPGLRALLVTTGSMLVEPRLSASFHLSPSFAISAGLARNYQTTQSLRNPESPAASVFGPDLPVLASPSVPIGRADEATLAIAAGDGRVRLTVDAYARRLTGLVLAQPYTGLPFVLGQPALGSGRAQGVGAGLDLHTERLTGRVAGGLSRALVSVAHSPQNAPTAYQPGFASTSSLTAAANYRLGDNTSLNSAFIGRWGRRTTLFDGAFEWAGCDAFDGGCEISGSPGGALGATSGKRLPAYLRWDVGARRAWTAQLGARDVEFALQAIVRNLLDRRNIWGYSAPGADGTQRSFLMRPVSLLSLGLDFRY